VANLPPESEQVDGGKRKVPEHQADEEGSSKELRIYTATDAAESSDEQHHG